MLGQHNSNGQRGAEIYSRLRRFALFRCLRLPRRFQRLIAEGYSFKRWASSQAAIIARISAKLAGSRIAAYKTLPVMLADNTISKRRHVSAAPADRADKLRCAPATAGQFGTVGAGTPRSKRCICARGGSVPTKRTPHTHLSRCGILGTIAR